VSLWHWFGGHDEPWRKLITDQPIEAMDQDSGEFIEIKPAQDNPNDVDGLLISFNYTDALSQNTTRTVLCYRCWQVNGVVYVNGYCTLRRELRAFRVDRMRDLSETRTRRKIANPSVYFRPFADEEDTPTGDQAPSPVDARMAWASRFMADSMSVTPQQIEEWTIRRQRQIRAREACMDGLRVLSYIALADDFVTEEEKNIQISYVEARLAMVGFDHDPELDGAMMDIARGLAVPSRSYARALNSVARDPRHFQLVFDAATRLAETASNINVTERHALTKLLDVAKTLI
jgi:hypothetical protein